MTTITHAGLWSLSSVRQAQSIAFCPISLRKILIAASPLRLELLSCSSLFRLNKNIKEISEGINQQTTCIFTSRFLFIFIEYTMRKSSTAQTRGITTACDPNVPAGQHSGSANPHVTVNGRDNGYEKPGLNGGQRGYATRLMILK
jgi:hypothetical protein